MSYDNGTVQTADASGGLRPDAATFRMGSSRTVVPHVSRVGHGRQTRVIDQQEREHSDDGIDLTGILIHAFVSCMLYLYAP